MALVVKRISRVASNHEIWVQLLARAQVRKQGTPTSHPPQLVTTCHQLKGVLNRHIVRPMILLPVFLQRILRGLNLRFLLRWPFAISHKLRAEVDAHLEHAPMRRAFLAHDIVRRRQF